jgi:hypothetical protein
MSRIPGDSPKNVEQVTTKKLTYFERIQRMFRNEIEESDLSEDERKYLFAVRMAYGMMMEAHSTSYVVGVLIKEHNVAQRTAYNIINDAQRIFGQIQQTHKEFARIQAIEMAKFLWATAKRRQDVKGMNKALENFIRATGIDRLDPDLPDFERLAPSLNILMLPEGMEEMIKAMLTKGVVNLNATQEAEYVELPATNSDQG